MRTIAWAILALAPAWAQDSEKSRSTGEVRKEAWKDGTIVQIRVAVSTESRHLMSSVQFPEESIQGLVQGWTESDISLDHKKGTLFVKLLKKAEGHLHVLGASGTQYTLYISAVDADRPYDAEVVIEKPNSTTRKADPEKPRPGKPIGSIDLIRSMRLGTVPPDGTVKNGNGKSVFATEKLAATLAWKYETLAYTGYVLDVKNASPGAVRLDLSRFQAPGLVLLGAREMTVEPGSTTRLYLVFWKD